MSLQPSTTRKPETKSMGVARYRNQLAERSLGRRLEVLDTRWRGRCRQLGTQMGQLQEHLRMMSPLGTKTAVCPKGLTEDERAQYRKLRRNSGTTSMSVQELDLRLTDFRQLMRAYRRRSSLPGHTDDAVFQDAGIIDLEEHKFCAPLTKHKHTMKEALKRATTAPRATEVSPQFAALSISKPSRRHSESSAAAVADDDGDGSPSAPFAVTTPRWRPVRRSVPNIGQGYHHHDSQSAVAAPSAGPPRTPARPLTACSPPSAARSKPAEKAPPRCKSATSGRQEARRQEIVICPDYVAARRMSVDAVHRGRE